MVCKWLFCFVVSEHTCECHRKLIFIGVIFCYIMKIATTGCWCELQVNDLCQTDVEDLHTPAASNWVSCLISLCPCKLNFSWKKIHCGIAVYITVIIWIQLLFYRVGGKQTGETLKVHIRSSVTLILYAPVFHLLSFCENMIKYWNRKLKNCETTHHFNASKS